MHALYITYIMWLLCSGQYANCITDFFTLLDCSIEGQIRKTYTSHHFCHARCFHTDDICPLLVIMDECECPDGMVIHDLKNKCVLPEECPGTVYVVIFYESYIFC